MKKLEKFPFRKRRREALKSKKRRSASCLQMAVLHFEALTLCFCGKHKDRGEDGPECRRCQTVRGAKRELWKAGIKWVRGVRSDVVGVHRKRLLHSIV